MSKLDEIVERNHHDRLLPGDLKVTLRYPSLQDALVAGGVPLPMLKDLEDKPEGTTLRDLTDEERDATQKWNETLIRQAVVKIEGEDVDLIERPDVKLVDVFDDAQRKAILAFARREEGPAGEG